MRFPPMTTGDVARYCHVTVPGVLKWIKADKLRAYSTPGGHFRIRPQDFRRFLEENDMPVDEEFFLGSPIRILVVDDEEEVRDAIVSSLESSGLGCETDTAADGYEAGVKIARSRPHFVLLDLKMPGLDGFAVCTKIKSDPDLGGIRVLAMTGYYTPENVNRIMDCGADGVMAKPFSSKELVERIRELIGESRAALNKVGTRRRIRR